MVIGADEDDDEECGDGSSVQAVMLCMWHFIAWQAGGAESVFDLFRERIAREPRQIIRCVVSHTCTVPDYGRYLFDGRPLAVLHSRPTIIPPCAHCGSARVFECQLLPSFVSVARTADQDTPLSFASVEVHGCARSCWRGDTVAEHAVVVPDPDEHVDA